MEGEGDRGECEDNHHSFSFERDHKQKMLPSSTNHCFMAELIGIIGSGVDMKSTLDVLPNMSNQLEMH